MALILDGTNTPTLGGVGYGNGTKLAFTGAGTAGGVLYSAGGAAPVFSAAGTAGQVLTSGGAGAPTWAAPATSGLVFISSQTVSTPVASVDFTAGISSTYDDYQIVFENVTAASANAYIQFFLYQSGSFSATYSVASLSGANGNIVSSYTNGAATEINVTAGTPTTATTYRGNLLLMNVNSATARGVSLMGLVAALGNAAAQSSIDIARGSPQC